MNLAEFHCAAVPRSLLALVLFAPVVLHAGHPRVGFCAIEVESADPLAPAPLLSDINDWNEVVGTESTASGTAAIRWDLFRGVQRLAGDDAAAFSGAYAINELGQIAGYISDETRTRPIVWDDAQTPREIPLGALGGVGGIAVDINNASQVVGQFDFGPDISATAAYFFDPESGLKNIAGLPVQGEPLIGEINGAAEVAGDMSRTIAFVWTSEANGARALPNPPGPFSGGAAFAINEEGTVVGSVFDDALQRTFASLWRTDGRLEILPSLPLSTFAQANDINDFRIVVGRDLSLDRAIVWDARRGTRDLNSLLIRNRRVPRTIDLTEANAINNRGWIVATARDSVSQASRSFVLVPVRGLLAALCRRM